MKKAVSAALVLIMAFVSVFPCMGDVAHAGSGEIIVGENPDALPGEDKAIGAKEHEADGEIGTLDLKVTYQQTKARSITDTLNRLRTDGSGWIWNQDNTEQVSVTADPVTYDYGLEKVAMQRAAELIVLFSHERPNSEMYNTLGKGAMRENIACYYADYPTDEDAMAAAYDSWLEENEGYEGQAHRRNMLDKAVKYYGAAYVKYGKYEFYVQEFDLVPYDTEVADAADDSTTVTVEYDEERMEYHYYFGSSPSMTMKKNSVCLQPKISKEIHHKDQGFMFLEFQVDQLDGEWTSRDSSIVEVDGKSLKALKMGEVVMDVTCEDWSSTYTIKVEGEEFKVDVKAVGTGFTSPEGINNVDEGSDLRIHLIIFDGYQVNRITVDGVDQTFEGEYFTLKDVRADHTVVVYFGRKPGSGIPDYFDDDPENGGENGGEGGNGNTASGNETDGTYGYASYKVGYHQGSMRKMIDKINTFRTSGNGWAYDPSGQKVKVVSEALVYDYGLEAAAMQRAAELVMYYSHTRPDGNVCFTAVDEICASFFSGENIAAASYDMGMEGVYNAWLEENENYSGQGHRRNMLSSDYGYVGIACASYEGCYYYVQEFSSDPSGYPERPAVNSTTDVTVRYAPADVQEKTGFSKSGAIKLNVGASALLPSVKQSLRHTGQPSWLPSIASVAGDVTWTSSDSSVAAIEGNKVRGYSAGSATLTAHTGRFDGTISCKVKQGNPNALTSDPFEDASLAIVSENCVTQKLDSSGYTVKYVKSVSYNGVKHIEYGGKASVSKAADVVLSVYDKDGNWIFPADYKVSFVNSKNVATGVKRPGFKITLKDKSIPAKERSAIKKRIINFDITRCDLSALKLRAEKYKIKDQEVFLSRLTYTGSTGKVIKLKQSRQPGKGDFTVKGGLGKGTVSINGINNYKGSCGIKLQ